MAWASDVIDEILVQIIYLNGTRLCTYGKLNIITATKIFEFKIVGVFRKRKQETFCFPIKILFNCRYSSYSQNILSFIFNYYIFVTASICQLTFLLS